MHEVTDSLLLALSICADVVCYPRMDIGISSTRKMLVLLPCIQVVSGTTPVKTIAAILVLGMLQWEVGHVETPPPIILKTNSFLVGPKDFPEDHMSYFYLSHNHCVSVDISDGRNWR